MNAGFPIQEKGTYILVLYNQATQTLSIGKLGQFQFKKGYYLYIGSAFGPGGLSSRVGRHLCVNKRLRWHIDYLTTNFTTKEIWYSTSEQKLECRWCRLLVDSSKEQKGEQKAGESPIKGLGSSDCSCYSHLFYFAKRPKLQDFQKLAASRINSLKVSA